jgi:hypothetical protein
VLDLINARGPQSLDALVPEVVAAGRTRARDPRRAVISALEAHPAFLEAWDGRWCSLTDQLEGAIFTTPLTTLERRDEIVLVRNDLTLVGRLAARSIPLARGGEVHVDLFGDYFDLPSWYRHEDTGVDAREVLGDLLADDLMDFLTELGLEVDADENTALVEFVDEMWAGRILHGPPGWLPPLGNRDLLGFRFRSGAVETIGIGRREVKGPHVGLAGARVARLAQLVLGPDASWFGPLVLPIEELLEIVATEAPDMLRRPLPPFEEVVRRGGLEALDGYVAHRGTDWNALAPSSASGLGEPWGFESSRIVH